MTLTLVVVGYLTVAVVSGVMTDRLMNRLYPLLEQDPADYLFLGFMGMMWPVVLPLMLMGWGVDRVMRVWR